MEGDINEPPGNDFDGQDNYAAKGDVCLGTLTIPLSRLPLEEAFGLHGKDATVVEQWYQLDDPGQESTEAEDPNDNEEDEDEPTLLKGLCRCPSMLLEITFASSDHLDLEYIGDKEMMNYRDNDSVDDNGTLDLGHARKESDAHPRPLPSNRPVSLNRRMSPRARRMTNRN